MTVLVDDQVVDQFVTPPFLVLLGAGMQIARIDHGQRQSTQLLLAQTLGQQLVVPQAG